MSPNTIRLRTGTVTTNTRATFQSMVKASTTLPKTMKGERINSRKNIFRPFCTWLISLVSRVIRVLPPNTST